MAVYAPNSYLLYRDLPLRDQPGGPSNAGACSPVPVSGGGFFATASGRGRRSWRREEVRAGPFWQDISRPTSISMEPIESEEQLDQVLRRSQEEKHLVLIDWMAAWCRKCIYLKPKLEKLAAEYHPRIKIYFVDVNNVPQSLVKRGNISKMPTIQAWKDGEWKEEVIGGHKAWLVLDEVREMIQKYM